MPGRGHLRKHTPHLTDFALRLREAQEAASMSQGELADYICSRLGTHTPKQADVSRWLSGSVQPPVNRAEAIMRAVDPLLTAAAATS